MSAAEKLRARLAELKAQKTPQETPQVTGNGCAAPPLEETKESKEKTTESIESIEYTSVVTTEGIDTTALPFKNMLLELEEKLNNRVENFPYLLRDVHQHLRKDPEIVTILTDEEIGLVIRGLKTMTGTILGTTTAAKKTGGRAKKSMPVTADML